LESLVASALGAVVAVLISFLMQNTFRAEALIALVKENLLPVLFAERRNVATSRRRSASSTPLWRMRLRDLQLGSALFPRTARRVQAFRSLALIVRPRPGFVAKYARSEIVRAKADEILTVRRQAG
jgi:hypothetical protein